MDILLKNKLEKLLKQNPQHWYITQQVDDFPTLCACVECLKNYQIEKGSNPQLKLDKYFSSKGMPNFRALNNARYLGLLTNEGTYEQETSTATYDEIKSRVDKEFSDIEKYQDIINRQIEKFKFTSEIDNNQTDNSNFSIFGMIFLYKVLLEMGTITGRFEITEDEYDFLVTTTEHYEDFYETVYLIQQARKTDNIDDEYRKIRSVKKLKEDGTDSSNKNFDERTKHLVKQNSFLECEEGFIRIKKEHIKTIFRKIELYEKKYKHVEIKDYVKFLDSTKPLIIEDEEKEFDMPERKEFENYVYDPIKTNTEKKFNRIIFGAPGTGKSHQINLAKDKLPDMEEFERVTFHPNYSYAQFVGTYKPVTNDDGDIAYKYVEGPFMRLLTAALENAKDSNKENRKRYLLIIEEINRANVAAVFGDMFQLLDRDTDGVSDYEIQTSEDVRKYLADKLGGDETETKYKTLKLPNNFYIWATMNSADQGVQPMDAAFKRRWNFEFLNIDEGKFDIDIPIPNGVDAEGKVNKWEEKINWNALRTAINSQLKTIPGVNEDKLLGPFFIGNKKKIEQLKQNKEEFNELFKSKILMYLFEDVVKMNPSDLFNRKEGDNVHYSDICKEFDQKGLKIFVKAISDKFNEFKTGENN